MRIAFILITVLFLSCENKEQIEQKKQAVYDQLLDKEMESGVRNDTIFLGYRFGMSQKEFSQKTKELQRSKKLYVTQRKYLAYKMTVGENSWEKDLEATFSPEYHEDKLFKLGISVKSETTTLPALIQLGLVRFFKDKYGLYDHIYKTAAADRDYYWIDGNREIEITTGLLDARIYYTDKITEYNYLKHLKNESLNEINSAKEDI